MFNIGTNQILLLSCLLLVIGVGTYVTYFHQRGVLNSLDEQIEEKQQEKERIQTLQTTLSDTEETLVSAREEWQSQYKVVPETTSSPVVMGYLTELTQTGFQTFDVTAGGGEDRDDYSAYTFQAEGEAYFSSLYRFVWTIENNRPFYRIRNLSLDYLEERTTDEESGRTSMDVLVSFQMDVEAIYGAVGGMEPDGGPTDERQMQALPVAQSRPSPPLPASVVPDPSPDINPFYPLVFEEVPPNQYDRLNVEAAKLISIISGQAVFEQDGEIERVGEGDRVYLGRIVEVDASEGRVVARLNRGGIVDTVELRVNAQSPLQKTQNGDASP
ncbi:MAG: hypothetical protein ACLFTE_06930 [Salinivenus sp.]